MVLADGGRGETWPDRDEWNRWHRALSDVARRLRDERGVEDPWRLTVDPDVLMAEYGELRLRVAGDHPDLHDPRELFDVDSWVAFQRTAGPGRALDRDRRAMARWRRRLPAMQTFWEGVARRLFRDIEATTDLDPGWRIVVHHDEPARPGLPPVVSGTDVGGVVGGIAEVDGPPWGRRPLAFPEVWLETAYTGRQLPGMTDEAEALGYLAGELQDDIIEQVHGAWPQCPVHAHPLAGGTQAGRPVWQCPTSSYVVAAVGELGSTSPA